MRCFLVPIEAGEGCGEVFVIGYEAAKLAYLVFLQSVDLQVIAGSRKLVVLDALWNELYFGDCIFDVDRAQQPQYFSFFQLNYLESVCFVFFIGAQPDS